MKRTAYPLLRLILRSQIISMRRLIFCKAETVFVPKSNLQTQRLFCNLKADHTGNLQLRHTIVPTLQRVDAPRRQGFYLGLLGGPMFSQVKNQRTTKPGFDVGMQVGYTISKKIFT